MKKKEIEKIKLSPFVHMVKGAKNYALYDLFNQRLFGITPEGNIDDLKKQLIEANLAVETDGVIPFKYEMNLDNYKNHIQLRELQIRITGQCDRDCGDCGSICECFKGGEDMPDEVLNNIAAKFKNIPITQVLITGGNPFLRLNIARKIRESITAFQYILFFRGEIGISEMIEMTKIGFDNSYNPPFCKEVHKEDIQSDAFPYFYSREYNICWGHKIAVDVDGSIRVCLWSEKTHGNILKDNVKEMIMKGVFDDYWSLGKKKIEICQQCEYRFGCPDCRVQALKETGSQNSKKPYCKYDPQAGCWHR